MDHLKILKRALEITWKYRALWLIGLILVLAGGGVGAKFRGGPPPGSSPGGGGGGEGPYYEGPRGNPDWSVIWPMVLPIVIVVVLLILAVIAIALLIGFVKLFARYVARTSLIQMVQSYEETGEEIGFWRGLRLGWSRSALNLFGVRLIANLPLLAFGLLAAVFSIVALAVVIVPLVLAIASGNGPAIAITATGAGLGFLFGLFLLFPAILLGLAINIVVTPIIEVASRACVIRGLGAWDGIKEAIGLMRRNLWPSVLQYLLLIGLSLAWNTALVLVNLPLFLLALFVGGLPALLLGSVVALLGAPILGLVFGVLAFIPVVVVVTGLPNVALSIFATVYHSTAWTLTFRELCALDSGSPECE